jgi:hypothetical protein
LDDDIAHATLIDLGQKLRERDVLCARALPRILEKREQRQQQQDDDHPEGEITEVGVHQASLPAAWNRRGSRALWPNFVAASRSFCPM